MTYKKNRKGTGEAHRPMNRTRYYTPIAKPTVPQCICRVGDFRQDCPFATNWERYFNRIDESVVE